MPLFTPAFTSQTDRVEKTRRIGRPDENPRNSILIDLRFKKLLLLNLFIKKLTYPLQKEGKNNTKTAKSSNLPKSIPNESSHFDVSETCLKFPLGPIISPNPGPTFEIDVAAPEIAERKSSPVIESNIAKIINKNR
tara:strand:- start:64 stop:471 length:408 start_codon:yes stop_codon:yes gene_type:complete